jgi:hypothetical protein
MTTRAQRLAALATLLSVLGGCSAGDDRPLHYLQTLPEDGLAYPGATATCTVGTPEKPFIDDPGSAMTEHCYTIAASESTVVAWYSKELASRGWRRQDVFLTDAAMPAWEKEFVRLHLRRVNVQDDEDPNPVTFSVALIAARSSYDIAPIPGLRALPESKLSYPGSTHLQDSTLGRMTGSTSATPAKVEQMSETTASVDDIKRYFDRELIARGWKAVDPPSDLRFGWHPSATWQKNEVLAALMASRASSATVTYYWFAIAEILGPDQTPGLPWE